MVNHIYIIAEIGVNHNGNFECAKEMVQCAAECGVDCVKFQTFSAASLASKYAETAEYHKKNVSPRETHQLDMLKKFELKYENFTYLKSYCEQLNVDFLSTPFDCNSVDFLQKIGLSRWKIPSGEITNLPYLIKIAKTHKPIILSTGMSTMCEIKSAVSTLETNGAGTITLLHCNTEYPTPFEDVNLNAMKMMSDTFHMPVGYSDHTKGIEVAIAASALGACMIEKHFTLDRNMEGPDHKASLEPHELGKMVQSIRNIEKALGTNEKVVTDSERKNIDIARKSIIASKSIIKGEMLTEKNLTTKRPGNGISPMNWFDVLGKTAIRDFEEDELIEL